MVRIIARGKRNLVTNFDVSGTFSSRLMGQHMSDAPRDIATLTFEVAGGGLSRVLVLHLYTKFEVRRPFRSEDMTHFRSRHNVSLVTLTFSVDLGTGAHYCP